MAPGLVLWGEHWSAASHPWNSSGFSLCLLLFVPSCLDPLACGIQEVACPHGDVDVSFILLAPAMLLINFPH